MKVDCVKSVEKGYWRFRLRYTEPDVVNNTFVKKGYISRMFRLSYDVSNEYDLFAKEIIEKLHINIDR